MSMVEEIYSFAMFASPPPPPPLPDVPNPSTSRPPPLTPSPAATFPSSPPLPATGRGKSQRWCRDTPPSGKTGGDAPSPSFKYLMSRKVQQHRHVTLTIHK